MADDPFSVLGLPRRFGLTHADIEQAYLARVAASHPDMGADSPSDAAKLNTARERLLDPETRARSLADLLGGLGPTPRLDPAFLTEILDARERAERAVQDDDRPGIERWLAWARERRADFAARAGELLDDAGDGPLDEAARAQLADVLARWRYIERMLSQVGPPAAPDA